MWKFLREGQYSTARAPGNNYNYNNNIMANSTTPQGVAIAAIYVNGSCVRPGVTARGEVIGQPGQVLGGQQGANRTDFKKMCQEYHVYFQQLPQVFDQFKEGLEAPLLAKIVRLEEDNKQLRQKTVDQRGMLEDSLKENRKLQKATKGVIKGAMEWETEALSLRENFLYQEEKLVSLREQVGRLQHSNNILRDSYAEPSGPVPVAQPQIQGLPGLVKVEVSVALHPNGERPMVDQVEVPQVEPVELDEAPEVEPVAQLAEVPVAQLVEVPAAQLAEVPAPQLAEVPAPVAQGRQLKRKEASKGVTWRCPRKGCHKRLANQDSLRHHKLYVHNKAKAILIPCTRQDCAKNFSKTSHRADHWRSFHGDPKLLCPSCDRPFSAVSKLNTHKRDAHGL